MTSRRKFLVDCSAIAVATTATPGALMAESMSPQQVSLDQISFGSFVQHQGTSFAVFADLTNTVELELMEARRWQSNRPQAFIAQDARNEKFSLLFRGPEVPLLPQHTYVFEHENIGRFVMFIVPILSRDPERYYEAVFNRPAPTAKRTGKRLLTSSQEANPQSPGEQ